MAVRTGGRKITIFPAKYGGNCALTGRGFRKGTLIGFNGEVSSRYDSLKRHFKSPKVTEHVILVHRGETPNEEYNNPQGSLFLPTKKG